MNTKILIVEDEILVATDLQAKLEKLGYVVVDCVVTGEDAVMKAEETQPDLALMDIKLKGKMDGIEAAEQIHTRFNIPVIYLTAYADKNILDRAKITEPYGYIVKPFKEENLRANIEMALYRSKEEKEKKEALEEKGKLLKNIQDVVKDYYTAPQSDTDGEDL